VGRKLAQLQGLTQIAGIARNRNGIAGIGKRERSAMSHRSASLPTSFMADPTAEGPWDLDPIPVRFRAIPRDSGDLLTFPSLRPRIQPGYT